MFSFFLATKYIEKYLRRVIDEIGAGPFDVSGQPPNPRQSYLQPNPQRLCPVTGEELGSMGSPIPVTISGRTIHVCCEACVASVKKNPAKYFAKVAQELKPFSNREEMSRTGSFTPRDQAPPQLLCPVTGEELGSMGPPIPVTVSGGRYKSAAKPALPLSKEIQPNTLELCHARGVSSRRVQHRVV